MKEYENYLEIQKERSDIKWGSRGFQVFRVEEFKKVMSWFSDECGVPKSVCCMGIRNGNEYFEFKKIFSKSEIYGVDINKKVIDVGDNCFFKDFNNLPEEWSNKFELIYSNSLDHAYDVQATLKEWARVSSRFIVVVLSAGEITKADLHSFDIATAHRLFDKEIFKEITIIDNHIIVQKL